MSTCPDCGQYLADGHRCGGRWRKRRRAAIAALIGALAGAVVPSVAFTTLVDPTILAFSMTLGAVMAVGLWKAIP